MEGKTKTGSISCSLCCEEKQRLCFFSQCGHGSCEVCIFRWVQHEETTGQTAPTCPYCRSTLSKEDVVGILGRDFVPNQQRKNDEGTNDDTAMDELTQQLLDEQTMPCPSCGVRIMKADGCDLMECLCGFRFCYNCGSPRARCNCTPAHHYFWDNILDIQAPRCSPATAPVNEETGQIDLARYIRNEEARRRFIRKHKLTASLLEQLHSNRKMDARLCSMVGRLDDESILAACVGRRKFAKKLFCWPYCKLQRHLTKKSWQISNLIKSGESKEEIVFRLFVRPMRKRRRGRFKMIHRTTMRIIGGMLLQRQRDMKEWQGDSKGGLVERCVKRRKIANMTIGLDRRPIASKANANFFATSDLLPESDGDY